ncbi:MAG TPA: deoxynucleoside kinase, partial [Flavobacterium sp.]|nr:deoxynucleoside kinase [Flavobacterium sp.]
KSVSELIASCSDEGNCITVANLESPLQKSLFERFPYIAFEGNIGVGKTTLVTKIAQDFKVNTLLERFADNSFLAKFYKNSQRYALPLELSFLVDRYKQLSEDLSVLDLKKDSLIADYHVFKSLIFAKVTLEQDEYQLYKNLFDIIYKEIPKPDLYVYLQQNPEQLLENIRKRARDYEQEISVEYLENINNAYLDYMNSQTDLNILVIDMTNRDFVNNQADYLFVLDEIQKKING